MKEKCVVKGNGSNFNKLEGEVTYTPANIYGINVEDEYVNGKPNEYVNRVEASKKPLEKCENNNKYGSISKGYYGNVKLREAICEIIDNGNDSSLINLSKERLPGLVPKKKFLYTVDYSESEFLSNTGELADFNKPTLTNTNLKKAYLVKTMLNSANL